MKKLVFLLTILLISYIGFSQSLTGLWVGTLSNDSSTIRKDASFEMALTEYRGKVYGYSHTTFMVHDTLFYIVKRVKGTINGNECEVKDDELISCNFMDKVDKGVKQIYTFHLNTNDSIWHLDGDWKTNKTKKYYSISGSVKTSTEKDLTKSKLFPHLQELNLNDAIASLQSTAKKPETTIAQPENKQADIAKAEPKKKDEKPFTQPDTTTAPKQDITKTTTEPEKKKEDVVVKNEATPTTPKNDVAKVNTDNNKPKPKEQPKQEPIVNAPKEVAKTTTEPEKKKEDAVVKKDIPVTSDITSAKPKEKTELPKPAPVAAVNIEKRKTESIQTINFKSDSITLALYDNGEIDGDTVSVLVNGEVVMPQQGLKATAIRKTIYITPAMQDSFKLVLYAENLGKYPPNTGLIIVRDGEDSYQVRFSADLQKNVEVLFRRKKQ
ncbi:MAG: hypothetical protein QM764_06490 [Chitinophagaceae bacterium]